MSAPPDRSRLRLSVFCFFFGVGLCFASWASRIPDIKLALGLSEAALGTILLAAPLGQMLLMPVTGQFVTWLGSRAALLLVTPAYALIVLAIGCVQQAWQLAAALFLLGIVGSVMFIATNTQAVAVELLYGRPIMASFHGGWSVAGFTGAAVGMLMRALQVSPALHFLLIAMVVGIGVRLNAHALVAKEPARAGEARPPMFRKPDPKLLRLGLIGFCGLAAEGTMFDWSGVYFQQVVRPSEGLILLGYAAFMSCMALGRFLGDRIAQRHGARLAVQASGLLIFTGMTLSVIFPNIVTATLGFMITGFGVCAVIPLLYSAAGRSGLSTPSMDIAAVSSLAFLGFLVAPPLIGYIAQASSLRVSFFVIALLGLCLSLLTRGAKLLQPALR